MQLRPVLAVTHHRQRGDEDVAGVAQGEALDQELTGLETPVRRCVSMSLHVDLSWILEVAERAGHRDPAPDDLGLPIAAVARHRAELLEQPVYGGPYARAAALVHTLGRCRWLERSNLTVACAVAVMYLNASGIPADPTREQLTNLAHELYDPRSMAASVAGQLRTWRP